MAIAFVLTWQGMTHQDYDRAVEGLDLHGRSAPGGLFHVAGPIEGGWRVVDVWESPEIFDEFFKTRLGPLFQRLGIPQPQVDAFPVHNMLLP